MRRIVYAYGQTGMCSGCQLPTSSMPPSSLHAPSATFMVLGSEGIVNLIRCGSSRVWRSFGFGVLGSLAKAPPRDDFIECSVSELSSPPLFNTVFMFPYGAELKCSITLRKRLVLTA